MRSRPYTQLLQQLAQRLAPAGYHYGGLTTIETRTVSPVLLAVCGIGVFAAAIVLLGIIVPLRARWLRVLLFALGCAESAGGAFLAPELQCTALALLAAIVFPCLSAAMLAAELKESAGTRPTVARYAGMTALGAAITLWGCCYIGAILSSSEYLLVLRLFRGVKTQPAGRVRRGHGAAGGSAAACTAARCARISRRCGAKTAGTGGGSSCAWC